jgi:hypothetical protein
MGAWMAADAQRLGIKSAMLKVILAAVAVIGVLAVNDSSRLN